MVKKAVIILFIMLFSAVQAQQMPIRRDLGILDDNRINEASGLAASRSTPGLLWTHNDSGGLAHIYGVDSLGHSRFKIILTDFNNRDWEDIAMGPGTAPGSDAIYIADTGDNERKYPVYSIYRFDEPTVQDGPAGKAFYRSADVETIRFVYPDGRHDAETLLVHPESGEIYVLTKEKPAGTLYRIPRQFNGETPVKAVRIGVLPVNKATGGDISSDGSRLIIKNYMFVYCWQLDGQPVEAALAQQPVMLPYMPEPQGEAIAVSIDNRGYFTLSEERGNVPAQLYFYPFITP